MRGSKQSLASDTRGAILIIGIVAGAILVGALWHIASVGDAILWRERAQDAADAAVFENAVWHARGMNMCAALNIVMAAVLSILVIWRTVLILVTVALVIATILCVVTLGTGCGFAGAVLRVETFMLRNDNKVANGVVRVIGAMNAAQVAVATATPVVALGTSKLHTEGAYAVNSAWTQSMSLLPSINDKGFQTLRACAKGWKAGKVNKPKPKSGGGAAYGAYNDYINQSRMGFVVSLPLQLDSYGVLCDKAGQFVLNSLAGVLESMGIPAGAIEGIDKAKAALGGIVSMLPGLFCAPMGTPPGVQQVIEDQSKESCRSGKDKDRVFVAGSNGTEIQYRDSNGKLVDEEAYVKDCAAKKKKEAKGKMDDAFKQKDDQYAFAECGQPSKVWEWAVNGNVFMRSFSQVKKDAPMLARDDKGLMVGAFQGGKVDAVDVDSSEIVAHAEIFYDCKGPWASSSCRSNAMWALRWKARLRRVQSMGKLASSALEPILVSTLTQAINELASDKASGLVKGKFKVPPILFPNLKDTWLARYIETEFITGGLYGSEGFEKVGNLVERSAADSAVIH